jgi:pantoate--beta-alanine ligase
MLTLHIAEQLKSAVDAARTAGREIVFVPTMGALHAGHLSLVELAKVGVVNAEGAAQNPFVVVSVFVNPLQFGVGEDFDRYPRTLEADAKLLEGAGVDVLFAPDVNEVYPQGEAGANHKNAGTAGQILEGRLRPGHFDGMLTVVARLFDLARPDRVIFGAKDAQQLFLVRQMAAKDYPELIVQAAPTVREARGLAMSSRNRFLNSDDLRAANALNRTLAQAGGALESGAPASEVLAAHVRQLAADAPTAKLDYLQLVSAKDFEPVSDDFHGPAILLIAAKIGETRLIDNLDVLI